MLREDTEFLPLSAIKIHPLSMVVQNKNQTESFRKIANITSTDLPIPMVGRINGDLYLLSRFDVFFGVQLSKVDNIECYIKDYTHIAEFLIAHAKETKSPDSFNPMKLFGIIDYLKKHNISEEQIIGKLQIHDTIHEKIINLPLHQDAIPALSEIFILLAEHLTHPHIPYYFIKEISKCDLDKQCDAVKIIRKILDDKQLTDTRFSFPAREEIQIHLDSPDLHQKETESVVSSPEEDTPTAEDTVKAEQLVKQMKNTIIIPKTEKHPAILVDKKTNKVSYLTENETTINVESQETIPVIALPGISNDDFDLNDTTDVKTKLFKTTDVMQKFLKSHPNIHGVMLYRNES